MSVYHYSAYNRSGKTINGVIDSESLTAARQKLRGQGMFPISIEEGSGERRRLALPSFSKVGAEDVYGFTRQLATLLGAGIPLVEALASLQRQITNATFQTVVANLKETVREGASFTRALKKYPAIFSPVYANMVQAGEASGALDLVLERLADFGEQQQILGHRVRAALIYPIFMTVIGSLILFGLLAFVVPGITEMFTEMNTALPWPTVALIGVSQLLARGWWLVAALLIGAIVAVRLALRQARGREVWDQLRLSLPIIGPLGQRLALARFARTTGGLLQSGVSLLQVLTIVRNIVNCAPIALAIDQAAEKVQHGRSLSEALAQSPWFPPMVLQMLSAGEQSGTLDRMCDKIATAYERETETKITALTALLEPVMILIMGLAVGFIVIAILLPIFGMQQLIR